MSYSRAACGARIVACGHIDGARQLVQLTRDATSRPTQPIPLRLGELQRPLRGSGFSRRLERLQTAI